MSFLPEHLFHKSSKNILWVKSNCFYSPWKWMMCCENEKEFPRGMKQKGMNLAKDKHKGSTWLCLLCSDSCGTASYWWVHPQLLAPFSEGKAARSRSLAVPTLQHRNV